MGGLITPITRKTIILLLALLVFFIGINSYALHGLSNRYVFNKNLIEQISSNIPGYTELEDMPEELINAVIAVEDKRFFLHSGFDVISIGRAFITNIKEGGRVEGGSTITQQLAKNLFLTWEKSISRKIKEVILAVKLENRYSKEEILEMYLNSSYFGAGEHGVSNAGMKYFGKNLKELSIGECAMLAGLLKAPSSYNPVKNYEKAKKRQKDVLDAMERNGYISTEVRDTMVKSHVAVIQY